MARVLYVYSRRNTFTRIDREALEERHEVVDYVQEGIMPRPFELWKKVGECDVVVGWFASWHTAAAVRVARMRHKPFLLIFGGFDTASVPEIGYGSQRRGGVRRVLVRSTARFATRLVTNSESSLREVTENVGIASGRATVVYHGIPDRFVDVDPAAPRKRMALTVGVVYEMNLARKGHKPFCETAPMLADVEFVLAGRWEDDAGAKLAANASENLRLPGFLPDDALDDLFRTTSVYVQASRHEGFGMSLAEAMLAGAVPVVTATGALPEVVGDTGVVISDTNPQSIAAGVSEALALGPEAHIAARERIRTEFPYEKRRDGILREVDQALSGARS